MPKDATKNIDRYKIRGGQLNEFDFHKNQAELAEQQRMQATNLIPGTPPEAAKSKKDTKGTEVTKSKQATKSTKATKGKETAKAAKAKKTTRTSTTIQGASAKKLAARKAAKKK